MRSSPQVGLSRAISTISFCSSAGTRGRPRGFDFHLQNSRKPFRCQRMKVPGLKMVRASRHANSLESNTRVNFVASFTLRGVTPRLQVQSQLLAEEEVLSGQSAMGPKAEPSEPQGIQQEIQSAQQQVGKRIDFRRPRQDRTPPT